jgi:hypothetical protein
MLEDALAILALYILSLSTTVVSLMLSEDEEGCSKDRLIAALQWGFSSGFIIALWLFGILHGKPHIWE